MSTKENNDFKVIRFWIFFISFIVCSTLGAFNIFATNKRVDNIEKKVIHSKNIICAMAFDLKWSKTLEACKN